jgi:alpha-glucosidase (family GH31 glycosyl hydrolase)
MFGDDILVAPVLTEGARERELYLPPGSWRDAWTGEPLEGGRRGDAAAPLELIPVYVRGNVSPFGPLGSVSSGGESA